MQRTFRVAGHYVYFGIAGRDRRFTDRDEALRYLRRLMSNPHDMRALRVWMFREVGWAGGMQKDDRFVLQKLAAMLSHGQISLKDLETNGLPGGDLPRGNYEDPSKNEPKGGDRPKPPRPAPPPKLLTWVEIKLIDHEGDPVPNAQYEVLDTGDAVTASGRLNFEGFARVEDLEPGSYFVRFPDLDRRAWKPA